MYCITKRRVHVLDVFLDEYVVRILLRRKYPGGQVRVIYLVEREPEHLEPASRSPDAPRVFYQLFTQLFRNYDGVFCGNVKNQPSDVGRLFPVVDEQQPERHLGSPFSERLSSGKIGKSILCHLPYAISRVDQRGYVQNRFQGTSHAMKLGLFDYSSSGSGPSTGQSFPGTRCHLPGMRLLAVMTNWYSGVLTLLTTKWIKLSDSRHAEMSL